MPDLGSQKAEVNNEQEPEISKIERIFNEITSYYGKDETIATLICEESRNNSE